MKPQSTVRFGISLLIGGLAGVIGVSLFAILSGAWWIGGNIVEELEIVAKNPQILHPEIGLLSGVGIASIAFVCGSGLLSIVIRCFVGSVIALGMTLVFFWIGGGGIFWSTILPILSGIFLATIDLLFRKMLTLVRRAA